MGSTDADIDKVMAQCSGCKREWFVVEQPQHTVTLDAFWIDKTEVTNAMYAKCVADGKCEKPQYRSSNTRRFCYDYYMYTDYPVIYVGWNQANTYCQWAGRRLLTEAEWEKAARGMDGRTYPWGEQPQMGNLSNFCDENCEFDWKDSSVNDGYEDTALVGSYPQGASVYGALDMAGNVVEWVADWYSGTYYNGSTYENPQGPASGEYPVERDGSWYNGSSILRSSNCGWYFPDYGGYFNGFRCARSP